MAASLLVGTPLLTEDRQGRSGCRLGGRRVGHWCLPRLPAPVVCLCLFLSLCRALEGFQDELYIT